MNPPRPELPTLRVRRAQAADAEPLAGLSGQLGYPATRQEITSRLRRVSRDRGHAVYVAEVPDGSARKLVGWVHVFLSRLLESDPEAEIGGLVVDQHHRGLGIGQRLVEEAERWARRQRCRSVRLRSNVIRTRAHAFYERLGFKVVKSQKVFRKSL